MQVTHQKFSGGIPAGQINMKTSAIVADALAAGKSLEEGIQEAQEWYDRTNGQKAKPEPQTVPDEPGSPQDASQEDESGMVNRRYLEAVCRFGFGAFAHLSADQLLDVACLINLSCPDVDEWRERRGL